MTVPLPDFGHLLGLSDGRGTFEHADHVSARIAHGYCTDDVARVVVVVCREPDPGRPLQELLRTSLKFLEDAQSVDGTCRNRMDAHGHWHGHHGTEDCWGRAQWAFGTAAGRAPEKWARQTGLTHFERGARVRSPWPRAMAFAALGAAEVVRSDPQNSHALELLDDAVEVIGSSCGDVLWPWPEPRLAYANAVLPDAMLAAGHALGRGDVVRDALDLLAWLTDHETVHGHLSVAPVGGEGPDAIKPGFDQQPIEAAALADAFARAHEVTADPAWLKRLERAVGWFMGNNDTGAVMWDRASGGGYDGLSASGPNLNEGAESTLATLSTLQHARRLLAVPV